MASTARISTKSTQIINEITTLTGQTKIEVIETALETYRHHERMRLFNKSYKQLRSNTSKWQEETEERNILEGTTNDGLEDT